MNTISASNSVNSFIGRMYDGGFLPSLPKITIGIVGEGSFSTVRIPKIFACKALLATKSVDVLSESNKFLGSMEGDIEFVKSPRQKFIDKLENKTASRWSYSPRTAGLECWENYHRRNKRSRDKKLSESKKRSSQKLVPKMKITGFPIDEPQQLNILDMIAE